MGYNASKKAYQASRKLEGILAIELMNAAQALDFLSPLRPSPATKAVYDIVRKEVPRLEEDQFIYPFIQYISGQIRDGHILNAVEDVIGALEF